MLGSRVLFSCLPRLRHIGLRNLELAFPELSIAERRRLLTESFENFGRLIADFAQFPRATPADLAARVDTSFLEAVARYRAAKGKGRGVIFVTPHLGNWEMLAFVFSAIFETVAYLARPLDNPFLERYTSRARSRFGNRPINKRDSILEGLAILDAGGSLGLLADVNTLQRDGVFVPFFGHLACTTRAVAMLALRTDAIRFVAFGIQIITACLSVNSSKLSAAPATPRKTSSIRLRSTLPKSKNSFARIQGNGFGSIAAGKPAHPGNRVCISRRVRHV